MTFTAEAKPDTAYEKWKAKWKPPRASLTALPGKLILEFSPHGTRGDIFQPEEPSNNAMVVADSRTYEYKPEGFLPVGTEVACTDLTQPSFELEGRTFHVVPHDTVEMYFPKEGE